MNRLSKIKIQDRLLVACQNFDREAARQALKDGAQAVPTFPSEPSPLMYAAEAGNLELVQLLLDAGASIVHRDDLGATALECAAIAGDSRIVSLLLNLGARDEPDNAGISPSQYADSRGHPLIAKLIRQKAA